MNGKKVGGKEVQVSPKMLGRLRERIQEVRAPRKSWLAIANELHREFSNVSASTLAEYVRVAGPATDYVFKLYADGKISYGLLAEIIQGNLDEATQDILAKDVVRLGMTPANVAAFKKVVFKCDYATALNRAMGKIPPSERMEKARKSTKDLETLEAEIADLSFHLQSRLLMAEQLMPKTLLGTAQARSKIFKSIWDVVHAARITVEFGEARIKQYMKELQDHEQSQIDLAERQGFLGDRSK